MRNEKWRASRWQEDNQGGTLVVDEGGNTVYAVEDRDVPREEVIRRARLAAVAPEMRDVLREVLDAVTPCNHNTQGHCLVHRQGPEDEECPVTRAKALLKVLDLRGLRLHTVKGEERR